jgi:hypothetical protein
MNVITDSISATDGQSWEASSVTCERPFNGARGSSSSHSIWCNAWRRAHVTPDLLAGLFSSCLFNYIAPFASCWVVEERTDRTLPLYSVCPAFDYLSAGWWPGSRFLLRFCLCMRNNCSISAHTPSIRFIAVFTRARHWSLSWARLIRRTNSRILFSKIHLPLSCHQRLGLLRTFSS